jgi:hypothetical protein
MAALQGHSKSHNWSTPRPSKASINMVLCSFLCIYLVIANNKNVKLAGMISKEKYDIVLTLNVSLGYPNVTSPIPCLQCSFNAGTPHLRMPSFFLVCMKDDSIEEIYDTLGVVR